MDGQDLTKVQRGSFAMRSSKIGALPRPNAKLSAILLLAGGLALAGCQTTETTAALPDTKPTSDSEVSNKAFQRAMEKDWNGQQCREYQRTVTIDGKTETAYGTACRQPDGTWKTQGGLKSADGSAPKSTVTKDSHPYNGYPDRHYGHYSHHHRHYSPFFFGFGYGSHGGSIGYGVGF
jgi:hypothetical protein